MGVHVQSESNVVTEARVFGSSNSFEIAIPIRRRVVGLAGEWEADTASMCSPVQIRVTVEGHMHRQRLINKQAQGPWWYREGG